jgi:quercetin dioxygenase-like cupin family protein
MAMGKSASAILLFLGMLVTVSQTVRASDPDLTTDYGINSTDVKDFTFTGFRNLPAGGNGVLIPTFATFQNFPGLTGLALTAVFFQFGPQSQITPHTHPRASEAFYVLTGTIDVGFIDTANNLFETTLQAGDLFVFPKGLIHWQRNNQWSTGSGYSVLNSENPGLLAVIPELFTAGGKGIPDNVLSAALGQPIKEVDTIKYGLGAKSNP